MRWTTAAAAALAGSPFSFLAENVPRPGELAVWGPPFLAWAFACLHVAGRLKRRRGWRTGYTRKLFHFLIFTSAAAVLAFWGLRLLCLFGAAVSAVVFYAVLRGEGRLLYEAIARETDAPRRTYFIIAPYLATLIGGLLSSWLFGGAALAGMLVTGFGDAVGEPIGVRFGRHTYRVPSAGGVPARRSLEGSAAVFAASLVAVLAAAAVSPELELGRHPFLATVGLALLAAFLEAVSPHGWDNAVLQVVPSLGAHLLLRA